MDKKSIWKWVAEFLRLLAAMLAGLGGSAIS